MIIFSLLLRYRLANDLAIVFKNISYVKITLHLYIFKFT